MHFALELFSAEDGRVEGSVGDMGGGRATFSGWLELLRLLEAATVTGELTPEVAGSDAAFTRPGTEPSPR